MTGYENYSRAQLHSLFSTNTWNTLDVNQKVNACQEVENRYAAENGVHPCYVRHEKMNGSTYGYQSGNTIMLNTHLLSYGVFITEYKDANGNIQVAQTKALAPSWNTLDTVYHEGTHGIQEATGRMPDTYIRPEMDNDLYRIQAIEKEAYATGQLRTLNAIIEVEQYTKIQDSDKAEYIEYVKMDSFNAALQDAIVHYNDLDIEQTVNVVIYDRDNGIIRTNCTDSYRAVNSLCNHQYYHANVTSQDKESSLSSNHMQSDNVTDSLDKSSYPTFTIQPTNADLSRINDGSSSLGESSRNISTVAYDGMGTSNTQIDNNQSNDISSSKDYSI